MKSPEDLRIYTDEAGRTQSTLAAHVECLDGYPFLSRERLITR